MYAYRFQRIRIVVGALLIAVTAGSCGGGDNSAPAAADVYYAETVVELPDGIILDGLMPTENGGVTLVGRDRDRIPVAYRMDGENALAPLSPPWIAAFKASGREGFFREIKTGPDGKEYLQMFDKTDNPEKGRMCIYRIDGGKFADVTPMQGEGNHFDTFSVLEDGSIVTVADDRTADGLPTRYSPDGAKSSGYTAITEKITRPITAVSNTQIAVLDRESYICTVFDPVTEQVIREVAFSKLAFGPRDEQSSMVFSIMPDGTLLLCTIKGLQMAEPGEAQAREVLNGGGVSFGLAGASPDEAAMLDNGDYLVYCAGTEGALYRYAKKELSGTRQTLTVQAMRESDALRRGIVALQNQNPEITVKAEMILDENSAMTKADALRTITAKLMAGDGADVYLLDSMPIASYIEKGALLDVGDVLRAGGEGAYLENITGAFQKDGKTYAIPLRFAMPLFMGSPDFLEKAVSLAAVADWAEQNKSTPLLGTMNPLRLLLQFFPVSVQQWLLPDNTVDSAELASFLEDVKRLADTQPPKAFDSLGIGTTAFFIHMGEAQVILDEFTEPTSINMARCAFEQNGKEWGIKPLLGDVGDNADKIFIPQTIVGINARSSQTEAAKALLETLLAKGPQTMAQMDEQGWPVRRECFTDALFRSDEDVAALHYSYNLPEGAPLEVEGWFSARQQADLVGIGESLNTPFVQDLDLWLMVREEAKPYFEEGKPLDATVSAIEARIQAYLAE